MDASTTPLAARMRPRSLDEVVGQDHLMGPRAAFRKAVESGVLPSVLLWGPPGCGKTSIARLLAERAGLRFVQLSAVTSGMKELREVIERARVAAPTTLFGAAEADRGTLLFVDEIHRWNKAQQDALLPHVEEGTVVLVGATTENPAFEVIPALRSRCWLLQLESLPEDALVDLLTRALTEPGRGLGGQELTASPGVLLLLARAAAGDARRGLSILERAAHAAPSGSEISEAALRQVLGSVELGHDPTGDAHYDVVSAFIKSLRGSDPDAALYWMARMLEGGEDPMFISRRMVIFAAEDIGNADPRALGLAVSAMQACHLVGLPEARIILGQACTYLSTAPKSNASYKAIDAAITEVRQTGGLPVPPHLRNAPTGLARQLGHGRDYLYPHDHPDHVVRQQYLPDRLVGARFYRPDGQGGEKLINDRLTWWKKRLDERDPE